MTIVAGCLGLAAGFGICWLVIRKLPQDKIKEINYKHLEKEQELFNQQQQEFEARRRLNEEELKEIEQKRIESFKNYENTVLTNNSKIDEIMREVNALSIKKDGLVIDVNHLTNQRADIAKMLAESKNEAEETAKVFLTQQLELASEQLDRSLEQAAAEYQLSEEKYMTSYLQMMKDCANQYLENIKSYQQMSETARAMFEDLQSKVDTAIAAAKREEEKRQARNFYRLTIPDSDLHEIAQLRAVEPYLRDKEALNKVIWKVYYEKPYTDLIGRVIGTDIKTGIYKITNIENNMCYIGQAANVADRWRQHIKRGLGAETPTRNKLYPAMAEYGVENFTFELVEECDRNHLDEREDFWQNYFHSKDYGYSIK